MVKQEENAVLEKHINYTKRIVLSHNQNMLTFNYAAISYTNSSKNQYAYMLEGFDEDWNFVGSKREASYTNLNPGKYIFRVRASNNDGVWNNEGTELEIIIEPPLWKRKGFIVIEAISIVLFVLLVYWLNIRKLNKDNVVLQNKVKERTFKIEQQKHELEIHQNHLENLVKARTQELILAKEKAEQADNLKSAFLANMSHEIRTPMNSIVGFSGLLAEPGFTEDERNEFITLINANANTLLTLIEDILDVSLIEANQIVIKNDVFRLNEVIDNVHSSFALTNKNCELEIIKENKLELQDININSDKGRITQIITNLINNACKFTKKGYVKLGVEKADEKLCFYVEDTGIGIPKDKINTVFGRFRKSGLEPSTARGVGLGLSISKRLAEILGGELTVDSNIHEGSRFEFCIELNKIT